MSDVFHASKPFNESDLPTAEKPFPIVEVFGFDRHLPTIESRTAFNDRACPFAGCKCEKFRQYGYGYCTVQYRTEDDTDYMPYAVCDHRLDGEPIQFAVRDYFGDGAGISLIPELTIRNPSQSFDFIAIDDEDDFVAIETQAIDLRGGGVGPAWASILEGNPTEWRRYFTEDAEGSNRQKDAIAYGVNMANITKRLGSQVAEKGSLLAGMGARLYVITQDLCFRYMARRIPAEWTQDRDADWDITFITFDFGEAVGLNGMWPMEHRQTQRTTLGSFTDALSQSTSSISRDDFVGRIKTKLKKGAPKAPRKKAEPKLPRKKK